jgi:hypothetical protein
VASPVLSFFRRLLRWTLWLGLLAALAVQLRVLSQGGLRVPDFATELLLRQTASAGLSAQVAEIWIDPRGRILLTQPSLGLAGASEFLASARSAVLQLRRRELLRGRLHAIRAELHGLQLHLPATHSPDGTRETLLENGEFILERPTDDSAWTVRQASARVLAIPTSFAGVLPSPPSATTTAPRAGDLARTALRHAADACRRLASLPLDSVRSLRIDLATDRLDVAAEVPHLLVPSHPAIPDALTGASLTGARLVLALPFADPALATLHLDARRLAAPGALRLSAGPIFLRLRTPAPGDFVADLSASQIDLPPSNTLALPALPPAPLVVTARYTHADKHLDASLSTRLSDAPWSARVSGQPAARSGHASASGPLTPALLEGIRPLLPAKARPVLTLTDPVNLSLDADFAPGGDPQRVLARASAGRAVAHHVRFDRASATLRYEPAARLFRADDLVLVQHDSRADGSYEMDTATLAFRFLLAGRLRPAGIDGWFGPWWPGFWNSFTFGSAPPTADVDIRGVWRAPLLTTIFVGASGADLRLRDLPLDTLDTRIQVNAGGSIDALGLRATRGTHSATGGFARILDPLSREWSRLAFDIRSDFPVEDLPRLFPAEGPAIVAPFALTAPPRIHIVGEAHGPASPTPGHQRYTLELSTPAPLRYQGFPLDSLSTRLIRDDTEIRLENLRAGFASGMATGIAVISGPPDQRWLAYDVSLADARLDLALLRWRDFRATRPDYQAPPPDAPADTRKLPGGALTLSLAATGPLADPLAHSGAGTATITGADLAQIRLLGLFSRLLADLGIGLGTLQLTDADARFTLENDRLRFASLALTGPSALVEADGIYHLPRGTLDFTARVRPLEQRTGILSSTVGWMLSPLSNALLVRLEGTLDQPDWTFSYGPTRLLRRITGYRPAD